MDMEQLQDTEGVFGDEDACHTDSDIADYLMYLTLGSGENIDTYIKVLELDTEITPDPEQATEICMYIFDLNRDGTKKKLDKLIECIKNKDTHKFKTVFNMMYSEQYTDVKYDWEYIKSSITNIIMDYDSVMYTIIMDIIKY
jgi:hypothetical protein